MNWPDLFTSAATSGRRFPICELLQGSAYYPASGHDGSVIRQWTLGTDSFVYVDTTIDEPHLNQSLFGIAGYHILDQPRSLRKEDLCPNGWMPSPPDEVDRQEYQERMKERGASQQTVFAQWTLLERDRSRPASHGPKHFSLLFIRGEGAATYRALYESNNVLPKYIAVIRPGVGFGGNYDDFEETLWETVKSHPLGEPPYLLRWGAAGKENILEAPWTESYAAKALWNIAKNGEDAFRIFLYKSKHLSEMEFVQDFRLLRDC